MFCKNCGTNLDDRAVMCPHCGVPTDNMLPPAPPAPPKTNSLCIAGFVTAIVGLCGGNFLILLPGIAGAVLCIVGLVQAKKEKSYIGLAVGGLAVSAVSLAFWIYVWVIAFQMLAQQGAPLPPVI